MFTSNEVTQPTKKQGRKMFEVNVRSIIAFREIGRGHEQILNYARLMNMQGISNSSFTNINNALFEAYEKADDLSIQKACQEIKDEPRNLKTDDGMTICRIHIDSSWQKRGHSSMNGYVAGISNGKVTDNHVMSKYCKQCQIWKHKKDTDEYENWKSTHICSINHQKSSGAM